MLIKPEQNDHLVNTGVVQKGEQTEAERILRGVVVDDCDIDSLWICSHTQTDEGDLDDRQQELETQGAADTRETEPGSRSLDRTGICAAEKVKVIKKLTNPGILFIRTRVLIIRAAMFLPFGSRCLVRTFQSAEPSQQNTQKNPTKCVIVEKNHLYLCF